MRRLAILVGVTLALGTGVACAATLSVGSWNVWAGGQTLTKGTCTVSGSSSITDTYVDQGSLSSSFGSATTMQVRAGGNARWTFVSANLSSCSLPTTAGADSATLKLVIATAPGTSRTLTITPVLSTWSGSLTWSQAQSLSYGAATTTFSTGTTNGTTLSIPVTVDIDALIKNPSARFGWRISDGGSGTSTTTFNSVNATSGGVRPQLVVDYAK